MAGLIHRKIGEIMMEEGWISFKQIEEALNRQQVSQERIGKVLLKMGCISERELALGLARQFGATYIDLDEVALDADIASSVSQALVKRYAVLPIKKEDRKLTLVTADPTDFMAVEDVRAFSGLAVEVVVAEISAVHKAIAQLYGVKALSEKVSYLFAPQQLPLDEALSENDTPVITIVNEVIAQAIRERASDIHVESHANALRVRFRVDGVLRECFSFPLALHPVFISRLKIMSGLDIAERRLPQDGRLQYIHQDSAVDLRVATMPTIAGEKVVLRILDCRSQMKDVGQLGFSEANLKIFRELYRQPHGLVLLTGKTGAGKTTTLYAVLATLNDEKKNIVTIENPVEYHLAGINQIQINPKIGLNFATVLRAVLRQDPNIIMVGEIRDDETADIAVKAALTGHTVFSTLHTDNALGAIVRLKDMGVQPFLIVATVLGIVAQRLVRCICSTCKVSYHPLPTSEEYRRVQDFGGEDVILYRGKGCKVCHGTGYQGRIAISEVLTLNSELKEAIVAEANMTALNSIMERQGFITMYRDGIDKALAGITTLEEVVHAIHGL